MAHFAITAHSADLLSNVDMLRGNIWPWLSKHMEIRGRVSHN